MRVLLLALLVSVSACKPPPITLESGARAFTDESYDAVYKAWTRSEESFRWTDLVDVLYVTATFESWEFRWAYVIRYAHDYSLESLARDEMLQASLAKAREEHSFFVSLAGFDYRESNLTGKTNAWRVLLIDPAGNQTVPSTMERIRRPTALERVYFPSVSPYRQAFRLAFPAVDDDGRSTIPPGADHVILRFTGARGRVDLRWDFEESASQSG